MNNVFFNLKCDTELQMTKGTIYPLQTRPPNRIVVINEYTYHILARAFYVHDDGTVSNFNFCINKSSILCGDVILKQTGITFMNNKIDTADDP